MLFAYFGECPVWGQTRDTFSDEATKFPSIDILKFDSSVIIKTQKIPRTRPVVLLFFSTTCDHCQKEAVDLLTKKESFKKIQLVMISMEDITVIRKFYRQYSLDKLPNLIIGRDGLYTGIRQYKFESFPYCVIYSKNRQFVKSFERNFNTENILSALRDAGEL